MLTTGTLIDDRYEIIDELGVGGFGAVYRALQKQFNRQVAIKTLNTMVLQERDGLARFEREAQAINALKHVNIVGFYGYGVWGQTPYMVMELVDGVPLQKELSTGCMEPRRALNIISQVLEALGCAHAAGVVHRDLKPSNIILTTAEDGSERIKIIDFGLAKLMPGYGIPGQKLTETGYALGTCYYMPPEQALGQQVDRRADVYAAGCLFYQMLAGKLPFDADNNIAVMMQHIKEQPQPLQQILGASTLTDALAAFTGNCMAKSPSDRYQSCDEALADVQAIQRGEFQKVQLHSPVPKLSSPKKSGRALLKVLTAALGLLIVLCLGLMISSLQQPKGVSAAEMYSTYQGVLALRPRETDAIYQRDKQDGSLKPVQRLSVINALLIHQQSSAKLKKKEFGSDPIVAPLLEQAAALRKTVSRAELAAASEYSDAQMVNFSAWIGREDWRKLFHDYALEGGRNGEKANVLHSDAMQALYGGQFQNAESLAKVALSIADGEEKFFLLCTLGEAQSMQGKNNEALASYERALKNVPNVPNLGQVAAHAYQGLARVQYKLGRYSDVLESAESARLGMDADETYMVAWTAKNYSLMALQQMGRIKESRALYKELVQQRKAKLDREWDSSDLVHKQDSTVFAQYQLQHFSTGK